jgi:hypothetical protein
MYIEYFTPFGHTHSKNPAQLYQVSHAKINGQRHCEVLPVQESLRMGCHLFPNFNSLKTADTNSKDILESCSKFYLNPFSSHFMYAYMQHWETLL